MHASVSALEDCQIHYISGVAQFGRGVLLPNIYCYGLETNVFRIPKIDFLKETIRLALFPVLFVPSPWIPGLALHQCSTRCIDAVDQTLG